MRRAVTHSHWLTWWGWKGWSLGSNFKTAVIDFFTVTRCDRGWKFGLTAKSRKVRTKCAASMWIDRCLWLAWLLFLISTPCWPEGIYFVHLWSCRQFRPWDSYTQRTETQTHPSQDITLFFLDSHSLLHTQTLTYTHKGDMLLQHGQDGVELLTGLQSGTMGMMGPLRWWRIIRWQTIKDSQRKEQWRGKGEH